MRSSTVAKKVWDGKIDVFCGKQGVSFTESSAWVVRSSTMC